MHTAQFFVSDYANNVTSRTISFYIQPESLLAQLDVQEPAARTKATFDLTYDPIAITNPEVTIKVTNESGDIVWTKTTSSFPYEWNLLDADNNRIPCGTYNFSGTFSSDSSYGWTNNGKLIILE